MIGMKSYSSSSDILGQWSDFSTGVIWWGLVTTVTEGILENLKADFG